MSESLELVLWALVCSTLIVACVWMIAHCAREFFDERSARRMDTTCGWSGQVFDSAEVSDRVRRLRQRHVETRVEKSQLQRRERVAKVRRLVSGRSYFQHFETGEVEQHSH